MYLSDCGRVIEPGINYRNDFCMPNWKVALLKCACEVISIGHSPVQMENLIAAIVRAEHNRGIVAGIRNSLRAPQERPLPFAIERLWFGSKEAQEHQEWPARCRQPIGFPRPARRIALNVQRQPTVSLAS